MTKIVMITKNAQGQIKDYPVATVAEGQTVSMSLGQSGIAKLGIHPDQMLSIIKTGNHAVVQLKDGSKVILENFFVQVNPQLVLQDGSSLWVAKVSQDIQGGILIDYTALRSIDDLYTVAVAKSVESTVPMWGWIAGGVAGAGLAAAGAGGGGNEAAQNN